MYYTYSLTDGVPDNVIQETINDSNYSIPDDAAIDIDFHYQIDSPGSNDVSIKR